jgi:hypothetical protein
VTMLCACLESRVVVFGNVLLSGDRNLVDTLGVRLDLYYCCREMKGVVACASV